MGKVIALLLIVLLALASVAGYVLIDMKIATGEEKLNEGRLAVSAGKASMQTGRQNLSDGKNDYEQAKRNPFLVWADKLLNSGRGFRDARKRIAEGQDAVDAGESLLDAGELAMDRGKEHLRSAKNLRFACALGAVVFALLSVVLSFLWRRSLFSIYKHNA